MDNSKKDYLISNYKKSNVPLDWLLTKNDNFKAFYENGLKKNKLNWWKNWIFFA